MKDNRRSFIKKSTALASALTAGGLVAKAAGLAFPTPLAAAKTRGVVRDAGMQMSEAYFDGFNQHKIALCKQMDVLGAVAGINPKMIGLNDAKPWDLPVIQAVKNAWDNEGLTLRVIEGPPALGEKTKLGLEGRDEEIAN